jgi:hypothetical protein
MHFYRFNGVDILPHGGQEVRMVILFYRSEHEIFGITDREVENILVNNEIG